MKIKTKLIISFCIIMFVPIASALLAILGGYYIQEHVFESSYYLEGTFGLSNSLRMINTYTGEVLQNMKKAMEKDNSLLSTETYLASVNELLKKKYSFLVVRKGKELVYNGKPDWESDFAYLPAYGTSDSTRNIGMYIGGENDILLKQLDFEFTGGETGSVFIITDLKKLLPELQSILIQSLISVLLILLFTATMLVMWVYRSMITPLRKLRKAAEYIQEGNLDFTMEVNSDDEIGDLCSSFEKMRLRLKDSAEEKIHDEAENRILISNIAHDLKTPITALKGYAEGIMDGVANTPEKVEKYVRTIYNKANEMDTLINELTLYSKIDTNRIPYDYKKINVSGFFGDCVEESRMDLEEKGVFLSYYNYVADDVEIIADPEQLHRVLNNIIGNSVKYMDKADKFLSVRIKDVGDFIQVELEDNGKGISQKDLPYIFDRFYRTDASRNSSTGGSGIGLSIVRKIVEDHGGKIWATSKEGTGTVMYLVIRKYQEVLDA